MQDPGADRLAVGWEEKSTEEDEKDDGGDTITGSVDLVRKKDKSG